MKSKAWIEFSSSSRAGEEQKSACKKRNEKKRELWRGIGMIEQI